MNFIRTAVEPVTAADKAYFFVFSGNDILVRQKSDTCVSIPCIEENFVEKMRLQAICFLGMMEKTACYCAHLSPQTAPDKYTLMNLRALYGKVEDVFWSLSGYARQIHDWNLNFQFCGRCGSKTLRSKKEHSRACPQCNLTSYPRISPAIITAVTKDNQILLARGVNFPNKKMFSVLAGFVEPGEALEDCIRREVFEEVGIKLKNIRYFKSQPWPFPDSLMIGFTAEYDSGEITLDTEEILEANWFTKDTLPLIPGMQSLAGELIAWFVERHCCV